MIKAEIISIGDELLYGQTLDTNAHNISEELTRIGVRIIRRTTVGDDQNHIIDAFTAAEAHVDMIIITGGLGPTSDDLTKACLANYFNCDLKLDPEALEELTAYFKRRGRELTGPNRDQAVLPTLCEKLSNPIGTAPGMWFDQRNKVFVSLPGVPHEMKKMISEQVIPRVQKRFDLPVIYHKIIRTIGIGESYLAEKIQPWEKSLPSHFKLAYLPSPGGVKLRLTSIGMTKNEMEIEANSLVKALNPLIEEYIFAYEDTPIESILGKMLQERHMTIATAESCTGGYIAHLLTSIPGSSNYYMGSIIPYSNHTKVMELGVDPDTIQKYGAVSEETAVAMASGVRSKLKTSIGVAATGIAGPSGGTLDKPVGTVWIAYSDKNKIVAKKLSLTQSREINIQLTATFLFDLIRKNIPPKNN